MNFESLATSYTRLSEIIAVLGPAARPSTTTEAEVPRSLLERCLKPSSCVLRASRSPFVDQNGKA